MRSPERFAPLRALDISNPADGCVVLVLASERAAKKLHSNPVWIRGVGWASGSPSLETRDWADAAYTRIAAEMAYRLAKVRRPATEIEVAEIDDRFSYKELQHVESLGLAKKGEAGKRVVRGDYGVDGRLPVNVSGGSLRCGDVFQAPGRDRARCLRRRCDERRMPARRIRGLPETVHARLHRRRYRRVQHDRGLVARRLRPRGRRPGGERGEDVLVPTTSPERLRPHLGSDPRPPAQTEPHLDLRDGDEPVHDRVRREEGRHRPRRGQEQTERGGPSVRPARRPEHHGGRRPE